MPAFPRPPVRAVVPRFNDSGKCIEVTLFFANDEDRQTAKACLTQEGFNSVAFHPQRGSRPPEHVHPRTWDIIRTLPSDDNRSIALTVSGKKPQQSPFSQHKLFNVLLENQMIEPTLFAECGIIYRADKISSRLRDRKKSEGLDR